MRTERTFEKRRAVRRTPASDEPLSQIRLRAGRELYVVNASDVGLLAEGEMRLLPGTHVDVHLVTRDGRLLVRSRVVRAYVHRVSPDHITYRGALSFDRPIATACIGYSLPIAPSNQNESEGTPYPQPEPQDVLPASEPSFP